MSKALRKLGVGERLQPAGPAQASVGGDGGAALCQTSASRVQDLRGDIPKCTRYTEYTITWKKPTEWQRFPAAGSARMVERCVVRARVLIRPLGPGLEIGTPRRASASACTRATDLHFHGQFVWSDIRGESDVAGAATAEPSAYCGGSESAVLGPLLARPGGWDALVPAPDDMQVAQVLFGKACSEHDWDRTNPRRPYKHLSYRYKEGWS
ncbi:hypothetical protein EDB89DRAFT_1905549 [Lactarius sanguifluus]|nr:hypothetical protein EDB89DRAFT_1905549 [Lactarius sanguifluus]